MPQAIPIVIAAAASAATAAGVAGVGVLGATAFTIGTTAISVGAVLGGVLSVVGTIAGALLNRPPDAAKQSIEAAVPQVDAKPAKRFGLGRYKFGGQRVASFERDRALYSVYIFGAHPFALGDWSLFLDDREVDGFEGNPFDMTGPGARPLAPETLEPSTFWLSAGNHTQSPQEWIDAGLIMASDRWEGMPVLWLKSDGTSARDFNKNYPRGANREVQLLCDGGLWIDPATQVEEWSATPAVIGYGLMRHALGLSLGPDDLDAQAFADAAIIEQTPLNGMPRYEMNGVIVLTQDRGDFIVNFENAAASQIVLQGGRWSYIPGVARQASMILTTEHIAGPPSLTLQGDSDSRFNSVEGSFIDPVLFTTATNALYTDEAALAEDRQLRLMQPQQPHVTNPDQAQRLDVIALRSSRLQRSWSGQFSGRAIFLTVGDVVTTQFGMSMWRDGPAIVRRAKTEVIEIDGRPEEINQLELREYDPDAFEPLDGLPPYISASGDMRIIERHATPPQPSVTWSGSGSSRAAELRVNVNLFAEVVEWDYSLNGGAEWITLPDVTLRGITTTPLRQESLQSGAVVRWRLRYAGGERLNGPYRETPDYTVPGAQPIPAPTGSITGAPPPGIPTTWAIPDDARIDALEIYSSDDLSERDPLQGTRVVLIPATPDTTETHDDSPAMPASRRYWGRCYGGSASGPWSDPVDYQGA